MIPTTKQCYSLWDKYKLPSTKRIHAQTVTKLALFLANKIIHKQPEIKINLSLLEAAAMLHDIDQEIKPLPGERHPDTGVRILKQLGMEEVAEVVAKHSVHKILDPNQTPKSWEQKILYLADRMVKYEVIGVDHRFGLWFAENLPAPAVVELKQALPKVKQLEQEIYQAAGISFADIQKEFNLPIK